MPSKRNESLGSAPATGILQAAPYSPPVRRALMRFAYLALLGMVVLCGVSIRFDGLGRESFWFDEAASYHYAQGTFAEVVRHSYTDETNPPGFHLLIHYWMRLVGIEEWALRIPSAIAGSVSLILMVFFARLFLSRRGSLIATALLACAPQHVWYSQECRAFAIWMMLILAAYLAFWSWLRSGQLRFLGLNALFIVLAVSFHYFGVHAALVENAYLLLVRPITDRRRLRPWLLSQAALALALVSFATMMLMVDRTNVAWWHESGVNLQSLKSLVFHLNGVYFFLSHEWAIKSLMLLVSAAAFCWGVHALRCRGQLGFLLVALILPVLVNLAYSLLVSPILGNSQSAGRYFLLILPPYLVLLAAGWQAALEWSGCPRLGALCFAVFVGCCLWGVRASHVNVPFTRDDNRRLCGMLLEHATPGDLIIAAPFITLEYYARVLGRDLRPFQIVKTSRFDPALASHLPQQARHVWCYLDPLHHFSPLLSELQVRYGLRIALELQEARLSGAGLVGLAPAREAGR